MQGSIFTSFSEMVIEKMGMAVWNDLLAKVRPTSEGIYTNGMWLLLTRTNSSYI
jgi:hypothetical protein